MIIEIKIPSPGESVNEVVITQWLVKEGSYVEKDQEIAEIESDKATLPLISEDNGTIHILAEEGKTVEVESVACTIDTKGPKPTETKHITEEKSKPVKPKEEIHLEQEAIQKLETNIKATPLAYEIMKQHGLNINDILSGLRKISAEDVQAVLNNQQQTQATPETTRTATRNEMSPLRKKISERLVAVKNQTAMLTTFNEVDMSALIRVRNLYKEDFQKKYGIKLGYMSFFAKAVAIALGEFSSVNAMIDGEELVYFNYVDLGIAVQTDKGLMVPVIRDAGNLDIPALEVSIFNLAEKARTHKIAIDEMSGGTFTITNGGVFGSLFSTPIINPPQGGILGMHNIVERPVAVNGKVEIRPMMYIALTYDHRIIDGRDSVLFLKRVKELVESPQSMLYKGNDINKQLLGL